MRFLPLYRPARSAPLIAGALALFLAGCSGVSVPGFGSGGSSKPPVTNAAGEIDVRQFIGPDYCPAMSVRDGTELVRQYEAGREDDPGFVIWQASISETARDCLYDGQGNLDIRIGVSGRVLAGPKGRPGNLTVPLRIVIVKHQEAVLYSELFQINVTIPPENSTVFRQVYNVRVPSPGQDRDYLIYVGFDEEGDGIDLGISAPRDPEIDSPAPS